MGTKDDKTLESELLSKIVENTEKTSQAVSTLAKKFELHVQKMDYELREVSRTNEIQNQILEEHHKRSDRLEEQNTLVKAQLRAEIFGEGMIDPKKRETTIVGRIEKLEAPKRAIAWSFTIIMAILGLVSTIYKFF